MEVSTERAGHVGVCTVREGHVVDCTVRETMMESVQKGRAM